MKPIEQALFRVRQTASKRDPVLLAATERANELELNEIADWFSESPDDSPIRFDLSSIFFQPLPLGNYLIGMISPEEPDLFSLFLPPESFFVHCLIVPAETLLYAGNHPIALYERLRQENLIQPMFRPPVRLEPLSPVLPAELIRSDRLTSLFERTDPAAFVAVLISLFYSICTVCHPPPGCPTLTFLSAIFDFMPILERTELTFSSAFLFSRQNPLRMIVGGDEGGDPRASLARLLELPFFSFDETVQRQPAPETILLADPWPRLVYRVIKTRSYTFWEQSLRAELATLIAKPWATLSGENGLPTTDRCLLHEKAALWSRYLENDEPAPFGFTEKGPAIFNVSGGASPETQRCFAALEHAITLQQRERDDSDVRQIRLREAMEQLRRDLLIADAETAQPPASHLRPFDKEITDMDSLFARTLFGDNDATEILRGRWNHFCHQAPTEVRESTRESYLDLLRRILALSSDQEPRDPERNVQVLDLMLLFLGYDPPID